MPLFFSLPGPAPVLLSAEYLGWRLLHLFMQGKASPDAIDLCEPLCNYGIRLNALRWLAGFLMDVCSAVACSLPVQKPRKQLFFWLKIYPERALSTCHQQPFTMRVKPTAGWGMDGCAGHGHLGFMCVRFWRWTRSQVCVKGNFTGQWEGPALRCKSISIQ